MLDFHAIHCPYCGEPLELAIDASAGEADYIEDCQVCCRPISVSLRLDEEGEAEVHVRAENDA